MIPALVVLGVSMSAWAGRSLARRRDRGARLFAALVGAGAGVAAGLVATSALSAPFSPWDTVRLAPSMALARGFDPYAGPASGAVLSTMYGPVAPLAFLPAAAMGDPAAAAMLGRLMAFAFTFAPLAVIGFDRGRSGRGRGVAVVVVGSLAMLMLPPLRYSSSFLHADAPALGLAGAACLLTARGGASAPWAAIYCVLGVLTKQTLAPLPLALVASAWMLDGRRAAVRLGLALGLVALFAAALLAATTDVDALWINMVSIPGGVPWRGRTPGNLLATACELLAYASPLLAALGASARLAMDEAARRRSVPLIVAALALAPMAVLGRVKEAGDVNSFSPALYPLLLLACARWAVNYSPASFSTRCAAVAVLALLTTAGACRVSAEARLIAIERPFDAEIRYLATHPGAVYFPWHPTAHLAAEGRPTHHLFSAWERGEAGFPVGRDHLLSAIPERCRFVAFPLKRLGPTAGFGPCMEMLREHGLLEEAAGPVRLAGLPDYECFPLRR